MNKGIERTKAADSSTAQMTNLDESIVSQIMAYDPIEILEKIDPDAASRLKRNTRQVGETLRKERDAADEIERRTFSRLAYELTQTQFEIEDIALKWYIDQYADFTDEILEAYRRSGKDALAQKQAAFRAEMDRQGVTWEDAQNLRDCGPIHTYIVPDAPDTPNEGPRTLAEYIYSRDYSDRALTEWIAGQLFHISALLNTRLTGASVRAMLEPILHEIVSGKWEQINPHAAPKAKRARKAVPHAAVTLSAVMNEALPYMFQTSTINDVGRIKRWYAVGEGRGGMAGNAHVEIRTNRPLAEPEIDVLALSLILLAKINEHRHTTARNMQRVVEIDASDYMKMRGIDTRKHAIAQLDEASKTLAETGFDVVKHPYTYRNSKRQKMKPMTIYPIERKEFDRGRLVLMFTGSFVEYVANSFLMCFPLQYYMKLRSGKKNRNPHAAMLIFNMWPILTQKLQGGDPNQSVLFSVPKLISYCPGMPDPDNLTPTQKKNTRERLSFPLIQTLNACNEAFQWEWRREKGAPCTEEELKKADAGKWAVIKKLYVEITLFPEFYPRELAALDAMQNG